ncbi:beta-N-acetylglucosaminidase domain-containing protein [Allorhizocola rhizosphaerae]|uniref:beta-N-acetylglucosaminidase domain-containing protein n=1 Tax=Allorhizocola rhizosphaerae TaxID=1872709 RepID=UPI000E3C2287|nr:beta-N-acetylglucosaminidase domain-containing protein [Allorhizocola rhizosphaerae]
MIPRRVLPVLVVALVVAAGLPANAAPPPPPSASEPLPVVTPTPQSMSRFSTGFTVSTDALTGAVHRAGVERSRPAKGSGVTVHIGQSAEPVLRKWGVKGPQGLPAGGYVLAIGKHGSSPTIAMSGVDEAGTFYAAQTLRQLVRHRDGTATLPGVVIQDYPAFAWRGGMESFYGNPWPQADLLRHLDFLGQHRMNAFQYTVSGDPRTSGTLWRSPYPPNELQNFAQAIARAKANHVEFIYRVNPEANVSPDHGICHALRSDLDALVARYQQMYDIGERVFSIGWDDVRGRFVCNLDQQVFGGDPVSPLAAAQAHVVNHVYQNFIRPRPDTRLLTVPTDYAGNHISAYRTRFAQLIPADVTMFWTGPQVVSPTITANDLAQAQQAFGGRRLLIFDNYPVNDFAPTHQHLGPLVGRDPALAASAVGFLANEMQEAEASLISLFTVSEYAWNPSAYQPQESWTRSLREFGGAAYEALRAYAEHSLYSPLHPQGAPSVQNRILQFRDAWRNGGDLGAVGDAILAEVARARSAPAQLRATLHNPSFLQVSEPWLVTLEHRAAAAQAAVHALRAQAAGDLATYRAQRRAMRQSLASAGGTGKIVAAGVYEPLFDLVSGARGSTVVRHDSDAMSVFSRGSNGHLQTSWQTSAGSGWNGFTSITGITMLGRPEVVVRRNGAMTAVVRGSDNRLWTNRQATPGGTWQGWVKMSDAAVGGDPTVVQADDFTLNVFVRGADGRPHTIWQVGSGWSALTALPGVSMVGRPAVVVGLNGTMSAYVRGTDNRVWTSWQSSPGSGWSGWASLGGSAADSPTVVMNDNGALSAFIRGNDGLLHTSWQSAEGSNWSGFTVILPGQTFTGTPEILVNNAGAMSAYLRGTDNRVWTAWQNQAGGSWSGWSAITEAAVAASSPQIIDSATGAASIFVLNGSGNMLTSWQTSFGSNWTGYANLGGSLTP